MCEMDMPCVCGCGELFDLNDGNSCGRCNEVFCEDCLEQPFDLCGFCAEDDD